MDCKKNEIGKVGLDVIIPQIKSESENQNPHGIYIGTKAEETHNQYGIYIGTKEQSVGQQIIIGKK